MKVSKGKVTYGTSSTKYDIITRTELAARLPKDMIWILYLVALLFLVILFLLGIRMRDRMAEKSAWSELTKLGGDADGVYDPEVVSSLPEPARRYFNYMIQPGTPLRRVVEMTMRGELGLGSKESPNYQTMRARQILSPPFGFVWKVKTGAIVGSDGATPTTSWTRFWLLGVIPIVRAAGFDHRRSAFGRVIVEAAVWSPASLLPAQHVIWEPIDGKSARATVCLGKLSQSVDISVDEAGRPNTVIIQRWTNANPEKLFRPQPFGGYLSEFELFEGYQLATRVEVGNHFGTDDYYPFFKAKITDIRFPKKPTL